jgi:hypothetical protein
MCIGVVAFSTCRKEESIALIHSMGDIQYAAAAAAAVRAGASVGRR